MTVIAAEKLSPTVGAQVGGGRSPSASAGRRIAAWTLEALEAHGALVFGDLHVDDATQIAFSKKLGRVEVFGKGALPEIFRVTSRPVEEPDGFLPSGDVRLAYRRMHGRHSDHGDVLSAHAVSESGGETEFASTYAAYEDLSDEEREQCLTAAGRPHVRGRAADVEQGSRRPRNSPCGDPGRRRSTRWCGRTIGSPLPRARRDRLPRVRDGLTRVGHSSATCLARATTVGSHLPTPLGRRRHGDLGQSGRTAPGLPVRLRIHPETCTAPHCTATSRSDDGTHRHRHRRRVRHRPGHQRAAVRRRQHRCHLRSQRCLGRGGCGQDRGGGRLGHRPHGRRDRPSPYRRRRRRGPRAAGTAHDPGEQRRPGRIRPVPQHHRREVEPDSSRSTSPGRSTAARRSYRTCSKRVGAES